MKNLNHAKVIQAVDKAMQGKHEEFVFEFLKGYGIRQRPSSASGWGTGPAILP